MFSYIGMDIVAATAAESRALADSESMKMAARKINIRMVTLYALAVLTASFVVPSTHPFINGGGTSVGSRSVFIIGAVEAGLPNVAQFFNAMFVMSAFTCAINSLYVASRVLHTLALRGQTGPEFITKRLRACRSGVPVRAVMATALLMLIAYMGRSGSPGAVCISDVEHAVSKIILTLFAAPWRVVNQLHGFLPDCVRHHLRNIFAFLQDVRNSTATFSLTIVLIRPTCNIQPRSSQAQRKHVGSPGRQLRP